MVNLTWAAAFQTSKSVAFSFCHFDPAHEAVPWLQRNLTHTGHREKEEEEGVVLVRRTGGKGKGNGKGGVGRVHK